MLVFISDIHFTDAKPAKPFNAKAFGIFANHLKALAKKAKAGEIELVLLGDIFDVIRSDYWFESESIRPWSSLDAVDAAGYTLKSSTAAIVERICTNKENLAARRHLKNLREYFQSRAIPFSITYIVGNHDWPLNLFPQTRKRIADFLFMDKVPSSFPVEKLWPTYRVFARHGDIYDPMNFVKSRERASLGDAIVIELLIRFHKKYEEHFSEDADAEVLAMLSQIDNVRPLLAVPAWVYGICLRTSPEKAATIKTLWNETVDIFLACAFVQKNSRKILGFINLLAIMLKISKFFSFRQLARFPLTGLVQNPASFAAFADREAALREGKADLAVYGHTHYAAVYPLRVHAKQGPQKNIVYCNTGTWRQIHQRTLFDRGRFQFMHHHEMTYLAVYLEDERVSRSGEKRRYEVWSGSLG